MSGGIEEPYTIAQLPRPIEGGRIFAAPVYSFNASRKRKRHEVAVGVDGESVTIYNIQNQSTASSYALPPHSYLAAPPCSFYCRRSKPLQPQRHTYIALRTDPRGSKARLVSFTENLGKATIEEREPRRPLKAEHQLQHGDIAGIDVISSTSPESSQDSSHAVILSYKNGEVECLSSGVAKWHHKPKDARETEVEYTTVLDLETAKRGLFKSREDALMLLNASSDAAPGQNAPPLLFRVVRSGTQRTVQVFALRHVFGESLHSRVTPLEEILTYEIPSKPNPQSDMVQYELNARSGMLYQSLSRQLTVFELSGTTPRISSGLGRKGIPGVFSFVRLTSANVLVVSPSAVAVFDTKYGTILSKLDLPSDHAQEGAGHLALDESTKAAYRVVSQYDELGVTAAISHDRLVAFQVGNVLDDGAHAAPQGPLLSNVMGKNKASELGKKKNKQAWEDWKTMVNDLVKSNDVQGLEALVAEQIKLDQTKREQHLNHNRRPSNQSSGSGANPLWDFSARAIDPALIEEKKAIYLLGTIFEPQNNVSASTPYRQNLEITVLSRNIMRWFALSGYLRSAEVSNALSKLETAKGTLHDVAPGDIMTAIHGADPTFGLMCDLVALPIQWELAEVVQGLKMFLQSLQDRDAAAAEDIDGDASMRDTVEKRLQLATAMADRQLAEARSMLESDVTMRSTTCSILLARLQAFPQKDVVQALHKMLTYEDIDFLIRALRVELWNGGWTTKYTERDLDIDEQQQAWDPEFPQDIICTDQAIRAVANFLSCGVEAIGLSGWLVGQSANPEEALESIMQLSIEVGAAVEGLYELETLYAMLTEIGKTAGAMQQKPPHLKRKFMAEDHLTAEEKMLPLGARPEPPLPGPTNSKAGKLMNRAAIEEQKKRRVGKYMFEKIRF